MAPIQQLNTRIDQEQRALAAELKRRDDLRADGPNTLVTGTYTYIGRHRKPE